MSIVAVNRRTILGAAALAALVIGSLWTGSGASDASAQHPSTERFDNPAHMQVSVSGTTLIPGVTAERALQVHLEFVCARPDVHVERGSGVVVIEPDAGAAIELLVQVGQVPQGGTWATTVTFDWNEHDLSHRRMREAGHLASATFHPDQVRTVIVAASPGTSSTRTVAPSSAGLSTYVSID